MNKIIRIKILTLLLLFIFISNIANIKVCNAQEEHFKVASDDFSIAVIPNDKFYDKQWYLRRIKAEEAWDVTTKSDVVIAVIDTGIQISHPDLKANIWVNKNEIPWNGVDDDNNGFIDDINGWNFVDNNNKPTPDFTGKYSTDGISHGTVVAGIIAAVGNNKEGIAGLVWKTKIMPLKALNDNGEGDTRAVIKAIDYAIANKVDIINFSFVGLGFSKSLENAVRRAYRAGIIMVAAAGNEASNGQGYFLDKTPLYPVCHDGENGENMVIGVSATDILDQKAYFSGHGTKCVDISAPGVSIFSTAVFSKILGKDGSLFNKLYDGYWSGTSMAVPMVSATVALIESVNPGLNRDEVIEILKKSADNIDKLNPDYLNHLGSGRLNVYKAVKSAEDYLYHYSNALLIAPQSMSEAQIKITDKKGVEIKSFLAYAKDFYGGAVVASGDIDGDSVDEIVTGAGVGGGPHVRVFRQNGQLKKQFMAYNPNFRGGVNVAVGDVTGDGIDEIITGAGFGGGPQVRIFDKNGNVLGQFFAYNENFRGGVNVAVGDVTGDGIADIVTGAGFTGGPQVRIFDMQGKVLGQFFAYNENFRGGVNVAVGDIDGGARGKQDEIITGAGFGGGPHVRIFRRDGSVVNQFFAYDKKFRGGVNVAAGDLDHDGLAEIVTGAGVGGGPHVRVFDNDAKIISSFYGYKANFEGGVKVSIIKL